MAYRLPGNDYDLPYHAGEFCGNNNPAADKKCEPPDHDILRSLPRREDDHNHCHGVPRSCSLGTSEELAAAGYVGVYLVQDSRTAPNEAKLVPTPTELMEPGKEHLYNMHEKFGLNR